MQVVIPLSSDANIYDVFSVHLTAYNGVGNPSGVASMYDFYLRAAIAYSPTFALYETTVNVTLSPLEDPIPSTAVVTVALDGALGCSGNRSSALPSVGPDMYMLTVGAPNPGLVLCYQPAPEVAPVPIDPPLLVHGGTTGMRDGSRGGFAMKAE